MLKIQLKNLMKNLAKNTPGMVLTEALIAVAAVATGSVIVSGIITNSVSSTRISRDYLVAQNFVTEAVESVKNIRDTNWLVRPDMRGCWLVKDPHMPVSDESSCSMSAAAKRTDRDFIVNWDSTNNTWRIEESSVNSQLDLSDTLSNHENYRLYEDSLGNGIEGIRFVSGNSGGSGGSSDPSKFYRSVNFDNVTDDSAIVVAKIEWMDGAKIRNITWRAKLFNYFSN